MLVLEQQKWPEAKNPSSGNSAQKLIPSSQSALMQILPVCPRNSLLEIAQKTTHLKNMAIFMEAVSAEVLGYTPLCVHCATCQFLCCGGYLSIPLELRTSWHWMINNRQISSWGKD